MPAFVFPGQGSQQPGMGRAWTDHPSWELVDDVSERAGRDVGSLLLDAGPDELAETRNAQLATFTQSLIVLDAVERLGIEPTICAGHSLGEYTALVAAGVLSLDDGATVVAERGEAMQAATEDHPGTMRVVLGLDDEAVDVACRRADGDVWVANHNGPQNAVIAGDHESIDRAAAIALELGARKVLPVAVKGAFHTPFMAQARPRLRKALREATLRQPEVPIVANVDAIPHTDADDWPALLSAQLCSPVRWRQTIQQLTSNEPLVVELGPGGVLAGLVRRTTPAASAISVATPADLDRLVSAVTDHTALQTFAAGHQGEHLYVSERVVISPCAGLFEPAPDTPTPTAHAIDVGTLIGRVAGQEVRSPFQGLLMGMLAVAGERVQAGQPVAWLRAG